MSPASVNPTSALQLSGSHPIKITQLWNVRSQCTLVRKTWNFSYRLQKAWRISGNFYSALQGVIPGKKVQNITSDALLKSRLVPKNHKKINKKYCKIFRLSKVARAEIQAFQILSSRNFNFFVVQSVFRLWMVLHFLFSTVSFPVILLFWALSLSPVWPNIEGRQDYSEKLKFFYFIQKITQIS